MARFTYTILSRAHPGKEAEYIAWYRDQHLPDVLKVPGVISGRLMELDFQLIYDLDEAPKYNLLTIYELECDDPAAKIASIKALAGSDGMPMTDALNKAGMIQAAGHVIASGG